MSIKQSVSNTSSDIYVVVIIILALILSLLLGAQGLLSVFLRSDCNQTYAISREKRYYQV